MPRPPAPKKATSAGTKVVLIDPDYFLEQVQEAVGIVVSGELEARSVPQSLDDYRSLATLFLSALGFPVLSSYAPIEPFREHLEEEVKERCKTSLFKVLDAIDEFVAKGRT